MLGEAESVVKVPLRLLSDLFFCIAVKRGAFHPSPEQTACAAVNFEALPGPHEFADFRLSSSQKARQRYRYADGEDLLRINLFSVFLLSMQAQDGSIA
jgi:hypothetical protein